jgi:hypothetical protein
MRIRAVLVVGEGVDQVDVTAVGPVTVLRPYQTDKRFDRPFPKRLTLQWLERHYTGPNNVGVSIEYSRDGRTWQPLVSGWNR